MMVIGLLKIMIGVVSERNKKIITYGTLVTGTKVVTKVTIRHGETMVVTKVEIFQGVTLVVIKVVTKAFNAILEFF